MLNTTQTFTHWPEKTLSKFRRQIKQWIEKEEFGPALTALVQEYCRAPIVLYAGAGVSVGPLKPVDDKKYGLPTWFGLLNEIAGVEASAVQSKDPWEAADEVVGICGTRESFKQRLLNIVEHADNYTQKYGQLRSAFLRNALTLQSLAAFTGQLTGRIINPARRESPKISYRSAANPRVHAVITGNYDCFLESAASTLYRKSPLRPVTALGSSAASATRIPVFHIHGYVSHPFYQKERRYPLVDRLVITRDDYEKVWNRSDVFGTTMGPQIHYLRYYTTLFVGFSFSDEYVRKLLCEINDGHLRHAERTHFALLPEQDVQKRGNEFFYEMGITPITFSSYEKIPEILGSIYRAGLVADQIMKGMSADDACILPELRVRTHEPTGEHYQYSPRSLWEIVQRLHDESVGAKFAAKAGEVFVN